MHWHRNTQTNVDGQVTPSRFGGGLVATCLLVTSLFGLASLSGCQSGIYDAAALPAQYTARPAVDVTSLDFSKLATQPVDSSHILQGDTLKVRLTTGVEQRPQEWALMVAEDGSVEVPLVGPVQVAGLNVYDAQSLVRQASVQRGLYRQPSVSVGFDERRTHRITIMGAVDSPGTYELPSSESHLLGAIVAAGGVTKRADTVIEVRQPRTAEPAAGPPAQIAAASFDASNPGGATVPPDTMRIDLISATTQETGANYTLRDGAVVMVKQQPPRYVQVIGLVSQPNRFEMPPGENFHVLDAIAMAHGLTFSLADKVVVIRQVPGSPAPVTIDVSISSAKEDTSENILLADGDVVSVEETPVTLVLGALQQFVRVGIRGSAALF